MLEERIINLEIKFSHQDDFINQLNEIVIAQQTTIARLEKEIIDIKRNLNSENGIDTNRTLRDDKPPHY